MAGKRLLIAILVLPVFAIAIGVALQEYTFRWALKSRVDEYRSIMNRHLPAFLEDQSALADLEVFKVNSQGKDAGPYLNPKVRWRAGSLEGARYLAGLASSPISIPSDVEAKLHGAPETWLGSALTFDYSPYDLSWMREVQSFDYWDLTDAPPIRELFERANAKNVHMMNYLVQSPLPEMKDILQLSKIRLMKGIKENNLPLAFAEVRHLAKLCYSTEELVGELIAVAILGTERVTYDYAVAHNLIKENDWKPIPPEQHRRLKGVLFGACGYFSPLATPELIRQTIGSPSNPIGKCAAIRLGTIWTSAVDRHIFPYLPLERDFRGIFDELQTVATDTNNGCRLKDIRAYWANPFAFRSWSVGSGSELMSLSKENGSTWISLAMLSHPIPYFRKAGGLLLTAIGIPSVFKAYEESNSSAGTGESLRR